MEEIFGTNPPDLLTKTDVEALIDRLASKELTFGCEMKLRCQKDWHGKATAKSETELVQCVLVEFDEHRLSRDFHVWYPSFQETVAHPFRRATDFGLVNVIDDFEILGHPIYLHDVLVKIFAGNGSQKHNVVATVIEFWRVCGIDKSLQSILEEAEWEEDPCTCNEDNDGDLCCGCYKDHEKEYSNIGTGRDHFPKQPHIRDLFQFLLQLGL